MRPRRPAALVLVASLVAPLVLAGERAHVVRSGESASAIAERSYGDSRLGTLLLAFNGRRGTTIHAGETLRLPYSDVHRVRSGDSWSALTRRYLGSSTAWQAVAELNGLALVSGRLRPETPRDERAASLALPIAPPSSPLLAVPATSVAPTPPPAR